jgi:hypothetical protein
LLKRTWAPLATVMLVAVPGLLFPNGPVGSLGPAPVRSVPALMVIVPVKELRPLFSDQALAPFLTMLSAPPVGSARSMLRLLELKLVEAGSRPVSVKVRGPSPPM